METDALTCYPAFHGVLASTVALQIDAAPARDLPVLATLEATTLTAPTGRPQYRWTDACGTDTVTSWKTPAGHMLAFGPDSLIQASGSGLLVDASGNAPPTALRTHQVLDQALPRWLGQRGHLVLHGAAFASGAGAVVVVGAGGAGKSTLAAAAATAGLPLIADDCVLLERGPEGIFCTGNHPYLRCHRETLALLPALQDLTAQQLEVEGKLRLQLSPPAVMEQGRPCPLAALILLADSQAELTVACPSPAAVLAGLGRQLFVLDPTDKAVMGGLLAQLAQIVARVPARRLTSRRHRNPPAALLDAVMQALSAP